MGPFYRWLTVAVVFTALIPFTPIVRAQTNKTADESAVLATMEQFFAAMTARDVDKMSSLVLPGVMTFSQAFTKDGPRPMRKAPLRDNLATIAKGGPVPRERMRDPIVKVHLPIALIWTAYDFHTDDAFSHCGIDVVELMKVDGAWKITSLSWTAETSGCETVSSRTAPTGEEGRAVLAAVERMTSAMRSRDLAAYASTLAPDGMSFVLRPGPDGPQLRTQSNRDDVASFAEGKQVWQERIWDAAVFVHGSVAALWAPYDFYIDGTFSHCGVDLFELFKIDGEWKMTNSSWTIECDGCKPSPLGR